MKERPILFSGPMVRAILDGRKTQTRRVVKPQRHAEQWPECGCICPYGAPGDRLWVRETWGTLACYDCYPPKVLSLHSFDRGWSESFLATACDGAVKKWRPSIHMPRWASRITLEVTGVRVERLQEISEGDAKAEGALWRAGDGCAWGWRHDLQNEFVHETAKESFAELWDIINGAGSWEANPWVWVVEFKRLEEAA